MPVLFPFGHGLSYTCFEYSNLSLSARTLKPGEKLAVSVNVRNTGSVSGKALVQLYVAPHHVDIIRPVRELKGFEKIKLSPGEEKTVTIELDERAFAHWNESYGAWKCERGIYEIQICENAHSPILSSGLFLDFPALRPFGGFTKDISLNTFAGVEAAEGFILSNFDTMISRLQSKGLLSDDFVKKYTGKAGEIIHGYCEDPEVEKLLAESLEKLVRYIPEEKYPEFDNLMERKRYVILAAFFSADYDEDQEGFRYNADIQFRSECEEWLSEIRKNQIYDTGVDARFGDEFITLTTCYKEIRKNGRFVLVARKIREGEDY